MQFLPDGLEPTFLIHRFSNRMNVRWKSLCLEG